MKGVEFELAWTWIEVELALVSTGDRNFDLKSILSMIATAARRTVRQKMVILTQ